MSAAEVCNNTRSACVRTQTGEVCRRGSAETRSRQNSPLWYNLILACTLCCVVVVLSYKLVCNKGGWGARYYKLVTNNSRSNTANLA